MVFKRSFLLFGILLAVAEAQQGYPRENPMERITYDPAGQRYTEEEFTSGDEIPGEAGKDYPTLKEIPQTRFDCGQHQFPGYYADTETGCQVFHICQKGGRKDSFICPNGTLFNQEKLVCDWWYNVDCSKAESLYSINEAIVRAMEDAERLAEEKKAAEEGYNYGGPNASRNQQQRPSNVPKSDFDTVVVDANRSAPRAQVSQPQRSSYERPEVVRHQAITGAYPESARQTSQITGATFGEQSVPRDAEVLQEPGREYLPANNRY